MRVPDEFSNPVTCLMQGQAYLAGTAIGQELAAQERVKVECSRAQTAGYPLARVVIVLQQFDGSARIKLRVIDGFIERMDLNAIAPAARGYVAAVLAQIQRKTHLRQADLERRLLLAGEQPGLTLNATFAAGKDVGGSVLVLTGRYRPVSASLYVDKGAANRLRKSGSSLLAVGIVKASGQFEAGDVVAVREDGSETPIGHGITEFSAPELKRILGRKSAWVRKQFPDAPDEVVHRDRFVLL